MVRAGAEREANARLLHDQRELASRAERQFIADALQVEDASKTKDALLALAALLLGSLGVVSALLLLRGVAPRHDQITVANIEDITGTPRRGRRKKHRRSTHAVTAARNKTERKAAKVDHLRGQLADAVRSADEAKAEVAQAQALVHELREKLAEAQAATKAVAEVETQKQAQIDALLGGADEAARKTTDLQQTNDQLLQQLEMLKVDANGQLGEARKEWENERRALETELHEAHDTLAGLREEMREVVAAKERERAEFEAQIDAAANNAKEREQLRARLDEKANEHDALKAAYAALTRDKETFTEASEKRAEMIAAEKAALEERLAQLTHQIEEEKARMLAEADGETKRLSDERAQLARDVEEFVARQAQTVRIAADAEQARTEVAAEKEEIARVKAETDARVGEAEAKLRDAEVVKQQAEALAAEVQRQQAEFEESGKRQRAETDKLRQKLASRKARLEQAHLELDLLKRHFAFVEQRALANGEARQRQQEATYDELSEALHTIADLKWESL
jgi:chromosome segregation ATPase